jgi:tetratricopeptide (TPR) repeat protein
LLYEAQGRYEEVEPLYVRALAIAEEQLGATHPSIGTSLNNLAGLYRAQGRYGEAESLYMRALAIYEQRLGNDHPNTKACRTNYQMLLQKMQNQRSTPFGNVVQWLRRRLTKR